MKKSTILFTLMALLLAACGKPAATATPAATITPFPTYNFVSPTVPAALASLASASTEQASVSTPDPARIDLGKARYVALQCGSCHGDAGQGTAQGSALAGTKLSEDDFINFLRTGGTVGSTHLFSTNRLSETGGENIYLYVLSLGSSK